MGSEKLYRLAVLKTKVLMAGDRTMNSTSKSIKTKE